MKFSSYGAWKKRRLARNYKYFASSEAVKVADSNSKLTLKHFAFRPLGNFVPEPCAERDC